jgi:hypothetical protein
MSRSHPRAATVTERAGEDAEAEAMEAEGRAAPARRYEFRIIGRLSERARCAFGGMDVDEVPAETVISGEVAEDGGVQEMLALIQSMGLEVVSVRRTPH